MKLEITENRFGNWSWNFQYIKKVAKKKGSDWKGGKKMSSDHKRGKTEWLKINRWRKGRVQL